MKGYLQGTKKGAVSRPTRKGPYPLQNSGRILRFGGKWGRSGSDFCFSQLITMGAWTSHIFSLAFSFLICRMGGGDSWWKGGEIQEGKVLASLGTALLETADHCRGTQCLRKLAVVLSGDGAETGGGAAS